MKPVHLTAVVTIMLAAAPYQSALAFSTSTDSDVSSANGVSRFSDPDDALADMTSGGTAMLYSNGAPASRASLTPAAPAVCTRATGACFCANCQNNK